MKLLYAGALCLIVSTLVLAQASNEVFQLKSRISLTGKEKIFQINELADKHRLVVIGKEEVQFWDMFRGEPLKVLPHHIPNIVRGEYLAPPLNAVLPVALSLDGSKGLVIGKSGSVAVWDLQTGRQIGVLKRDSEPVRQIGFCQNGRIIFVMQGTLSKMEVSFWDSKSLAFESSVKLRDLRWFYLSRDGRRFFTGADHLMGIAGLVETVTASNRLDVWDTRTGKIEKTLTAGEIKYEDWRDLANAGVRIAGDSAPVVSRDERFVAARSDNRVVVWEIEGGSGPKYTIAPTGSLKRVGLWGISYDGKYVLAGRNDKAEVYETDTGKLYRSFPLEYRNRYQLSRDNKLAFILSREDAFVRDLVNEKLLNTVRLDNRSTIDFPSNIFRTPEALDERVNISFSPDGKYFMMPEDGLVQILDASTGAHIQSLYDPERVKYGRDGKVTASGFEIAKALWLGNGEAVLVFNKSYNTGFVWNAK